MLNPNHIEDSRNNELVMDYCFIAIHHADRCRKSGQTKYAMIVARSVFPILLSQTYRRHVGDPSKLSDAAMLETLRDREVMTTTDYCKICVRAGRRFRLLGCAMERDCKDLIEACEFLADSTCNSSDEAYEESVVHAESAESVSAEHVKSRPVELAKPIPFWQRWAMAATGLFATAD